MTRMLASVTNVAEALVALDGGADIIDLKNPHEGALGALPLHVIERIVDAVDGRAPVSATLGDLPMDAELIAARVAATAGTGVDVVKVGLFGQEGHAACIRRLAPLSGNGIRIVAVMLADSGFDMDLLPLLAAGGFYGVMLDTVAKQGKSLLDWTNGNDLAGFVQTARTHGLLSGLAGSLRREHVPQLAMLNPDYLGFRGALCRENDRRSALDPVLLKTLCQVLHNCNRTAAEVE